MSMKHFRVGLGNQIVNSRYSATAFARADMLTATVSGADSYWVGDHLNSLFPRSIATPRYLGIAKLVPKIDAQLEPWTMLGYLASRKRFARLRLGVGVTDASRRNPAVTAQAAATLQLITRGRTILGIGVGEREGNERRRRLDPPRIGVVRFAVYQTGYDAAIESLRDALGEGLFDAAWAEGAALSTEEAIAYAQRGRGERKRPPSGWESLTPTERDVVRLVSEGLTNKDIAARLFISPRTVQTHLTHVYTKLGLTSRVQLVQETARHI
jgi:DNA-binding CsgD family transcriptional regulator